MLLHILSRKENNGIISYLTRASSMRQKRDAFDSKSNSLKSTNHHENDRPPLRLNVANKTPLHRLVKCSSMEFVLARCISRRVSTRSNGSKLLDHAFCL